MGGQRKALIVANDEYEQEALRNLLAPAADAEALGRVLGDPQIGDFAVQVVRNEPAHVIQAQIEEVFSESRPDDVLLLHFSGHGLKSESGELFFAASNTRPDRLGSTAVSADFVQRCMRASRSRSVVLLLDCCYGGAFAQGVRVRAAGDVNVLDSFPHERSGGGRGTAVITASSAMEYAFEGNQLADNQHRRPSVFTTALVEGLATGDADRDEDGWVSLDELYDYVFDKVREQNPHQTPSRHVELEGELYLARSRRRRIRAVSIPPDLQTAMTDPNMYTRIGAVSELRSRLASDNLPVAAGAYEALAELARTDVRYVADPAAAALNEAAVQPAQTELHFGRIEQGSAPPRQTVQLLGPPIARACVPRPSHDWIRVDQKAENLDISIDTVDTGTLRGSLSLKGPTGEAAIAIDIDLISPPPKTSHSRRQSRPTDNRVPAPTTRTGQLEGPPAAQARQEAQEAARTARQQIRREKEASRAEPERPEHHGLAARLAAVSGGRLRRDQPAEGAGTGGLQDESRFAGGKWRIFYASHFPLLGATMIVVPLFILATTTSRIILIYTLTPYWVMTVLGLAGIAGSAIDYRNWCGVSAVAVGVNSAWLSGYAVFSLEVFSHHWVQNVNLFLCAVAGIGFIGNGVILIYVIRPFRDGRGRAIDTPLLVFLVFMAGGLALLSIISALDNGHLLWLGRVAGVMFSAALLAELTGIVLEFVRVLQARGSEDA